MSVEQSSSVVYLTSITIDVKEFSLNKTVRLVLSFKPGSIQTMAITQISDNRGEQHWERSSDKQFPTEVIYCNQM